MHQAGRQSSNSARRGSSFVSAALSKLTVHVLSISSSFCPAASPSSSLLVAKCPDIRRVEAQPSNTACGVGGLSSAPECEDDGWWDQTELPSAINPRLCTQFLWLHQLTGSWLQCSLHIAPDCLYPLTASDPCEVPTKLSNCEGSSYPF